ncbi:MAG TPA: SDR family NAD(P)-dependent oxidoreductase [Aggregatilineales bacterium]|nr:SDR family NAD(P)-dependent oxidoreductase [Aggregatilineales bacterium]
MDTRYVLITGASKGIGRATALYLDKQGYNVFAGVRNPADGEALRKEASSRLRPIQIDVADQGQIKAAERQVSQIVGEVGLAGLVNNAGIAVGAPLEFIPIDELRRQLEINVVGQVAVTQAFLDSIRKARGRIVNVSSIGGRIAGPNLGAYHASKFALEGITDTLRIELKRWGIEVISIEPGSIRTPIWETSTALAKRLMAQMPPQFQKMYPEMAAAADRLAANSTTGGTAPEKVAEVIGRALSSPRPRTRYLVGPDAQIAGNIIARLPDRIRDRILGGMDGPAELTNHRATSHN